MITRDEARQIVQERMACMASGGGAAEGDSLIILDEQTIEKDWGWVFFYTSRLWQETGDIRYAIAGNAPFLVERESGRALVLGTAFALEHYLERYERYGDPHFEPGPRIRLTGCHPEVDRLAATKLVREHSGVGLQAARQVIEDCIAGRRPCVTTADPAVAGRLAQGLESLGLVVDRLSKNDKPFVAT